jgi:hypothetical protein
VRSEIPLPGRWLYILRSSADENRTGIKNKAFCKISYLGLKVEHLGPIHQVMQFNDFR